MHWSSSLGGPHNLQKGTEAKLHAGDTIEVVPRRTAQEN